MCIVPDKSQFLLLLVAYIFLSAKNTNNTKLEQSPPEHYEE